MQTRKPFLMCILVIVFLSGCNANLPFLPATPLTETSTIQPSLTPTLAPTATPTPTPTPIPGVRIEQGDNHLFEGDYSAALQEFHTAVEYTTEDEVRVAGILGVGQAYFTAGDCGNTRTSLEPLVAQYPDHAPVANAYYYLAECYWVDEDPVRAADAYASYIRLRPGVLDQYMRTQQGLALFDAGDYQGAIQAYQAAIDAAQGGNTERLQVRIARAYAAQGDYVNAIRLYMAIYDSTTDEYTKAEMDLLSGQLYSALGMPEQAFARYQDAVLNYPRSYDSYSALIGLVNAGQPVDELSRGLVDYYAGQYGVAAEAFIRYLNTIEPHDGTGHYYLGLCYKEISSPEQAINAWQVLIQDHPGDRYWSSAWFEIAEMQWYTLDNYPAAAQTMLDYVSRVPGAGDAPYALFTAARIQERDGRLTEAAATWERIINEYPNDPDAYRSLFLAGITHYRLGNYSQALTIFQRNQALAADFYDEAMASFWVGKTLNAQGDRAAAEAAWQKAAAADPTGYYSERAKDYLAGETVFSAPAIYDLAYNLEREKTKADEWVRSTFGLAADLDLSSLGELAADGRIIQGDAFWELGLYVEARNVFEDLRVEYQNDAVATYRLLNHFVEIGLNRSAILAARQVLDLAYLSDVETLQAPDYFNHIRFGTYYRDLVAQAAQVEDIHPLIIFSLIRQESFFESFAGSSAGARGLMQIMPATGAEISASMNWPKDYTEADLLRPVVNIPLGVRYLVRQRDYWDGDLYAALAAYNGGPGNTGIWLNLANGDPDLFVEVIRYSETQSYIRRIYENFKIYSTLYERVP